MKSVLLAIAVAFLFTHTAIAETIDTYLDGSTQATIGTANPACFKLTLIKRNSGALVTGMTAANIKVISGNETLYNVLSGAVNTNVDFTPSLTAIAHMPGVYALCVTPVNFNWQPASTSSGLVGGVISMPNYTVTGLVKASATDNGHFSGTISTHP